MKKEYLLLLISIVVALLIGEVALRVYHSSTELPIGTDDNLRCAQTLHTSIERGDVAKFNPLQTFYFEYAEHTGVVPVANFHELIARGATLSNGEIVHLLFRGIETSDIHTRNKENLTNASIRIAAIGDSYTWGAEVPPQTSYPALLERFVPDSQVLNYGIAGVGIDTMYLRWKHEVRDVEPDVVVLGVFPDDIRRARPCPVKPHLAVVDDQVVVTNTPPPTPEAFYHSFEQPIQSYLMSDVLYLLQNPRGIERTQYENGFAILDAMLDEMAVTSVDDETLLYVLVIDHKLTGIQEEYATKTMEILQEKGIPHTRTSTLLSEETYTQVEKPEEYSHFNIVENAAVANGVRRRLIQEDVIPNTEDVYAFDSKQNHFLIIDKNGKLSAVTNFKAMNDDGEDITSRMIVDNIRVSTFHSQK